MRLIISLLLFFAAQPSARAEEMILHLGLSTIRAELATTPEQRAQGLMRRSQLCANCGMLFVFPAAIRYSFWMKDTLLPLSIAFIAPDGRIINIAEMQPNTTERHTAQDDALFALEMNRNWFAAHGIKPGDTVAEVLALPAAKQ